MSREELYSIKGGNISAALLNSIIRGIITICDLGRDVGNAIRRVITGNMCPIK